MVLRTTVDVEFPHGATCAGGQVAFHQVRDRSGSGPRAVWTIREFSHPRTYGTGAGIDAPGCGDRKFTILARWIRVNSTRLHDRLCTVCRQERSVRALACRVRL